ncbi:hypothetical protein Pla175_38760 [Pirellulimonas nuda]|uniref:Uncharacterized protein n=1 Tax=Pirellulimonas nuda TaxID=2528009 RepID=A0A518DG66_9BACT|nr:hypothetical protein [Pirellulimonas nuda]QDU90471.1 hypothetical protein Pla175_38760 [Pirellulimonas nuda]
MNPREKMLWRAASAIAEVYARRQEISPPLAEPLPIDAVTRLTRMMRHANRRRYRTASAVLRPRLERALRDLAIVATTQAERLRAERRRTQPPLAGTLYWDLRAIDDEFPRLEIDFKRQLLLVATDPIELEEVSLGPFMIAVHWQTLGAEQPSYEVMALHPNPPDSNPGVTHPHVVDDQLCEGEGTHVLQAASAEGRLHDFVLILRQILQTYNESSAYVCLDRWHGVPCSDCSASVDADERGLCGRCDAQLCDECVLSCEGCGEGLCHGCREDCSACHEHHCRTCLDLCSDCNSCCCPSCLTGGVCDACIAEKESDQENMDTAPQVAAADAARVGQAPLPA